MEEWFKLTEQDKVQIINQTSNRTGMIATAVEKDWWVMIALRAVFSTEYRNYIIFKGGTSLSKAWNIIERFSEDIDLGIDRSYFNFNGSLNGRQVTNLRKTSCKFVQNEFIPTLEDILIKHGVKDFTLNLIEFERSDTDPLAIELVYKSLTENITYLKPRILIEMSSRSLRDPYEEREIRSIIGNEYSNMSFADDPIKIPTVLPSRTLLEKIFLLHEEFQKPNKRKIRSERMTRHLYDISRLMDTKYLEIALSDSDLYQKIVKHREMLNKISWVDYSKHDPKYIDFLPLNRVINEWKKDYSIMQESMFYGETESFEMLIKKLKVLKDRINSL